MNDTATTTTTFVKHLDHLNMSVRDLEASVTWYGRVFGFRKVEEGITDDGVTWAIVRAGEAMLCLYEHPRRELLDGAALLARGLHGLNHFSLRVSDPEAWKVAAEREGVEVRYGGAIEWPNSTSWYVLDPTGYEIEVAAWDDDAVRFRGAS
jgi:catechol 2,3-dioxygenase-like lactoylglutathione lyase family enzyme